MKSYTKINLDVNQLNIIYKRDVVETGSSHRNKVFSSYNLFNVNDASLSPNEDDRVLISADNSDIRDIVLNIYWIYF